MAAETASLLPKPSSPSHSSSLPKPSTITTESTYALPIFRILGGAACLFAPGLATSLFRIPITPPALVLVHMVGVRDLVIGEYTWYLRGGLTDPERRRELKTFLVANVATDVADMAAIGVCLARGTMGRQAAGLVGGAALVAAMMGVIAYRGLREEKL